MGVLVLNGNKCVVKVLLLQPRSGVNTLCRGHMAKKQTADEGVLVSAAKKIGAAAGKIASAAGGGAEAGGGAGEAPKAATPARPKKGKLQKKNKVKLPRKLKKAQKKARERAS
jgi:hypothetical protein